MMNKKRLLALLLAVVMVIGMVPGTISSSAVPHATSETVSSNADSKKIRFVFFISVPSLFNQSHQLLMQIAFYLIAVSEKRQFGEQHQIQALVVFAQSKAQHNLPTVGVVSAFHRRIPRTLIALLAIGERRQNRRHLRAVGNVYDTAL